MVGIVETGGEAGIRTLGTGVSPYNGLANRRIRPLCHLSGLKEFQFNTFDSPVSAFACGGRRCLACVAFRFALRSLLGKVAEFEEGIRPINSFIGQEPAYRFLLD